jgi:exopolysaccharide biosynthesis polyprenyl glycosylphosphotransferase
MIRLIVVMVFAGAGVGLVWIAAWKRAARRERETARLYGHYVTGIETLTQTYLLQAPSDEEWLAGLKTQAQEAEKVPAQAGNVVRSPAASGNDAPPQSRHRGVNPAGSISRTWRSVAARGPALGAAAESARRTDKVNPGLGCGRHGMSMSSVMALPSGPGLYNPFTGYVRRLSSWTTDYLRRAALTDLGCAIAAVFLAAQLRFGGNFTRTYVALSVTLPVLWMIAVWLTGGYDARFIGTGSEEFRKILTAGVGLTAVVAIFSYADNLALSRAYVLIAFPCVTLFDLIARYAMRKRLHKLRMAGRCLLSVVAVGHERGVAELVTELRRDRYYGLTVVGACVAQPSQCSEIAGVPVYGGLDAVTDAVRAFGADTVAVLACPEMDGLRLRSLAWELERTGTDLCVAPALLDVTGPRTTITPTGGLTLLHVDHPQLSGPRLVLKNLFDRSAAAVALILLAPLMAALAVAIRLSDRGPALFTQVMVGKDGRAFRIYKFRTMVVDAEQRKAELRADNDNDGVLFKLRRDPRVTAVGAHLRRWSIDELPQLINVFRGDMSLVGPRSAVPDEAAKYADHVRRRLAVKPGITGLWQVSGRSDLTWEESVRLDLRYVENWSFALDLQILWKTTSVLLRGSRAY